MKQVNVDTKKHIIMGTAQVKYSSQLCTYVFTKRNVLVSCSLSNEDVQVK